MMAAANPRFVLSDQPEVFRSREDIRGAVSYHLGKGHIRRLGGRLYTTDTTSPVEVVVRRNVWRIVGLLYPGAVVADRTAVTMEPAEDGSVFVVADRERETVLPGLRVRPRRGPGPVDGDTPWVGEPLCMSSRARAFLDNARPSRRRSGVARTLSPAELEEALDDYARRGGPDALNRLRDDARAIAGPLGATGELTTLDTLIGALQGTRRRALATSRGRARRRGEPYDPQRVGLLRGLHDYLIAQPPRLVAADPATDTRALAFIEAYFSNFIEGTEFTLEEAEDIVFAGAIPASRPTDAHDILGTYRLVSDPVESRRVPASAADLIELLTSQHAALLSERPEARPGVFKDRANQAGGTVFVAPDLVEGTLTEGWRFYSGLPGGFARATFAMFLVSEVHPFTDGNGRLARVLMNSELSAAGLQRIVVTTRLRDGYLSGLRAMTLHGWANTLTYVLGRLQDETRTLDLRSVKAATAMLRARGDFTPNTGGLIL